MCLIISSSQIQKLKSTLNWKIYWFAFLFSSCFFVYSFFFSFLFFFFQLFHTTYTNHSLAFYLTNYWFKKEVVVIAPVGADIFLINKRKILQLSILWFYLQESSIFLANVFLTEWNKKTLLLTKEYPHSKVMWSATYLFVIFCYLTKFRNTQYMLFLNNENIKNSLFLFLLPIRFFFITWQKFSMNTRCCLKMQSLVCKQTVWMICSLIINDTYHEEYFLFLQAYILFLNIKQTYGIFKRKLWIHFIVSFDMY